MGACTNRYAAALLAAASAHDATDAVEADLARLHAALAGGEGRAFRRFLTDPGVARARKSELCVAVIRKAGGTAHELSRRFLSVVFDRGRQAELAEMLRVFHERALDARGEVEGRLVSASPLDAGQLDAIAASLEARGGKKVYLSAEVDESLLGGFSVRLGHDLYDMSLRGQIEALGRKLRGLPLGEKLVGLG